jgi:hypothetical protein
MIQIVNWTGYYSFLNPKINASRGFEQTYFNIEILTVDKNQFAGTVTDDLSTGGMKGTGEINGKFDGNRIEFTKGMPVMTLIVDKSGSKKHLIKNIDQFIILDIYHPTKNHIADNGNLSSDLYGSE